MLSITREETAIPDDNDPVPVWLKAQFRVDAPLGELELDRQMSQYPVSTVANPHLIVAMIAALAQLGLPRHAAALSTRLDDLGPVTCHWVRSQTEGCHLNAWIHCPADMSLLVEKAVRHVQRIDGIDADIVCSEVIIQFDPPSGDILSLWSSKWY